MTQQRLAGYIASILASLCVEGAMFRGAAAFLWILSLAFAGGCAAEVQENTAVGQDGWLKGTTDQKFDFVAGQLRGFDVAMVETGYRFNELYFAGEDQNWAYAKYQAEKIGTAIRSGLERRPKRAASAETFLTLILPEVQAAIERKDQELFRRRFHTMLSTCNTCHANEKVEFVSIVRPTQRLTPVGPLPSSE